MRRPPLPSLMETTAKPAPNLPLLAGVYSAVTLGLVALAVTIGWFVSGAAARAANAIWFAEGWIALGAFAGFLFTALKTRRGRIAEWVSAAVLGAVLLAFPLLDPISGRSFLGYAGLNLLFLCIALHAGGFIATEIGGFAHDGFIERPIRIAGISAIIFVFGIFFFVAREGGPLLWEAGTNFSLGQFFGSTDWYPTSMSNKRYGILALIIGTLTVTALAMLIAVPFAIGGTIFISEFCSGKVKEWLKIIIELLAAIPSIVWGFIGLTVINPLIIQVFGVPVGLNVLNAAIILALMAMPIMVSIGEDALKAVPDSYREAAVALGTTRWQMIYRVLLPAAKNGLLAAVLLGVGRAVGETMGVLMATGHSINIPFTKEDGSFNPMWMFESCRTLTATIAAELGETNPGSPHYRVLFLIGILLLTITFVINLIADLVVKGIRQQK